MIANLMESVADPLLNDDPSGPEQLQALGVQPVEWIGITRMPPFVGGLAYSLFMLFVGYMGLIVNVGLLVVHANLWKAVFLSIVTCRALLLHKQVLSSCSHLKEYKEKSVATGFLYPQLVVWFSISPTGMAVFSLVLTPWGLLGRPLTMVQACIAVGTQLLHVWSVSKENEAAHCGDELRQLGVPVIKKHRGQLKLMLLKCWSLCNVSADSLMTVVMLRLHNPIVVAALYLPSALWNWHVNREMETGRPLLVQVGEYFLQPLNLVTWPQSSAFGLVQFSIMLGAHIGNKPAWPLAVVHLCRHVVMVVLACLDFTSMGEGHLMNEAAQLDSSNCTVAVMVNATSTCGNIVYSYSMVAVLVAAEVVHIASVCGLLISDTQWREGSKDEELYRSLKTSTMVVKAEMKKADQKWESSHPRA